MNDSGPTTSRRDFLTGLAGASLAVAGGLGTSGAQAAGLAFGPGALSGLPWNSGCGITGLADFEVYRGRRADTCTIWCPRDTWDEILSFKGGFKMARKLPSRVSMGMAPLPVTHSALTVPGIWKLAAKGTFDGYYTLFSQKLAASGRTDMIIRIGWETNRKFPWYAGVDPQGFKDTFKRIADILRRYNPTVSTEWCNVKKGNQSGSVLLQYPGDDAVDIIGVDYYDGWPALNTEAIWNKQYNATFYGGPWGIGAWMDFTKSRGKKMSCPEWGISIGDSPGTTDNPLYIQKMFEFFSKNSAYIAYENYFNQIARHQLNPTNVNPKASAMYRSLWGA